MQVSQNEEKEVGMEHLEDVGIEVERRGMM
jgi:hypothetical protein